MSAGEISAQYPFYNVDDIVAGNHNTQDEGYFDGGTIFDWWRKKARANAVEYCANEVISMSLNASGSAVDSVDLETGETISCGHVINCSGPRANVTAMMAGISLPVEPRKRYTFIFDAERKSCPDRSSSCRPGNEPPTRGRFQMEIDKKCRLVLLTTSKKRINTND